MLGESRVRDHFAEQAKWCEELGSPFTAELLRAFGTDLSAGGPMAAICGNWTGNPRKDALGLRIAGALHHAVLTGVAPELAAAYPVPGRDWTMADVWPAAKAWLGQNLHHVQRFIESPPQTNETRRSIALLPGFLELSARYDHPMNLLELGASAGLNQNWDAYRYDTDAWRWGEGREVTISTDWQGPPAGHLDARPEIAARAACDLSPVDLSDDTAVSRLKCYTWPDQFDRLERLDAAVSIAQARGTQVDKADALDWLRKRLANRPSGQLTVVYHSVFLIYPPKDVIESIIGLIEETGHAATTERPLAWLCMESEALFAGRRDTPRFEVRLKTWPGGESKLLARTDGHVTHVESLVR